MLASLQFFKRITHLQTISSQLRVWWWLFEATINIPTIHHSPQDFTVKKALNFTPQNLHSSVFIIQREKFICRASPFFS